MSILRHTQIGAQLYTAVQGSRQPSDDQSDLEIFTNPTKNFFSSGYPRLLCFRAQVAVRNVLYVLDPVDKIYLLQCLVQFRTNASPMLTS